jgi:hypothetical protein
MIPSSFESDAIVLEETWSWRYSKVIFQFDIPRITRNAASMLVTPISETRAGQELQSRLSLVPPRWRWSSPISFSGVRAQAPRGNSKLLESARKKTEHWLSFLLIEHHNGRYLVFK